ncbi:hypothetical protein [Helicobacter sp. 11S02596-1]|uniref:hypothetical protein n=1 Tax=Helicobacter sp. 11S02596-1 TaxID=1476194 RepID=UPI000BA74A76|nr:hypothetical protein [Helicobacter sp. 11S02596-1]PAF44206.1 hypothetical protein BJI48_03215 [Helicobacter sp. 11S02596-1]
MKVIKFYLLALLFLAGFVSASYADTCNYSECEGIALPDNVKKILDEGYWEVDGIENLLNKKYLFLSAENVNDAYKCSILFRVNNNKIESQPVSGWHFFNYKSDVNSGIEPPTFAKYDPLMLCDISVVNGNVVSSSRYQGGWEEKVYHIDQENNFILLLSDACFGFGFVQRMYFNNGKVDRKLVYDGEAFHFDYLSRQPLTGKVKTQKAFLYKKPDEKQKTKAYLIKGDTFTLRDYSLEWYCTNLPCDYNSKKKSRFYFQIDYQKPSGEHLIAWIRSEGIRLYGGDLGEIDTERYSDN